jgi:hypothetical protein
MKALGAVLSRLDGNFLSDVPPPLPFGADFNDDSGVFVAEDEGHFAAQRMACASVSVTVEGCDH